MPISDKDRISDAYDIIISSLKKEIVVMNDKTNNLLGDMEEINNRLIQLSNNLNDPIIAEKFKKMFEDPDVLYYYQLLQVMKSIPKRKIEENSKNPKK